MTREEKQKLEARRQYAREYRKKNAEKLRKQQKAYYKKNKKVLLEKQRAWREANPEKLAAWREANADRLREAQYAWRKANPDKVREIAKKQRVIRYNDRTKRASVLVAKTLSAKKRLTRMLENNLTTEYIQKLLEKQNFRCAFAGIELDHVAGKNSLRLASIDRKNSNRGYVKGNVQIVLNCLNKAKGESTDKEFRMLLTEIKKCKVS